MANSLSKVTTFDDEAITSAEALLLTFTKIGREAFPESDRGGAEHEQRRRGTRL